MDKKSFKKRNETKKKNIVKKVLPSDSDEQNEKSIEIQYQESDGYKDWTDKEIKKYSKK